MGGVGRRGGWVGVEGRMGRGGVGGGEGGGFSVGRGEGGGGGGRGMGGSILIYFLKYIKLYYIKLYFVITMVLYIYIYSFFRLKRQQLAGRMLNL